MYCRSLPLPSQKYTNPTTRAHQSHTTKPQSSSVPRSDTGKPTVETQQIADEGKQHHAQIDQRRQSSDDDNRRCDDVLDDEDDRTSLKDIVAVASTHNDSNVIAQIVEEYEMRLREQVTMAKEDIVLALEEQIQVSVCVVLPSFNTTLMN